MKSDYFLDNITLNNIPIVTYDEHGSPSHLGEVVKHELGSITIKIYDKLIIIPNCGGYVDNGWYPLLSKCKYIIKYE